MTRKTSNRTNISVHRVIAIKAPQAASISFLLSGDSSPRCSSLLPETFGPDTKLLMDQAAEDDQHGFILMIIRIWVSET